MLMALITSLVAEAEVQMFTQEPLEAMAVAVLAQLAVQSVATLLSIQAAVVAEAVELAHTTAALAALV